MHHSDLHSHQVGGRHRRRRRRRQPRPLRLGLLRRGACDATRPAAALLRAAAIVIAACATTSAATTAAAPIARRAAAATLAAMSAAAPIARGTAAAAAIPAGGTAAVASPLHYVLCQPFSRTIVDHCRGLVATQRAHHGPQCGQQVIWHVVCTQQQGVQEGSRDEQGWAASGTAQRVRHGPPP